MNSVITRTLACGIFRPCAKPSRVPCTACVDTHAVRLSPFHSHTQPCVSSDVCVCTCVEYVAFNRERRGLEAGVEIAVLLRLSAARVRRREHLRRFRTHRLLDGRQRRQYFPLELDQAQRICRLLLGCGGERADLFAGIQHLVAGLDRDQHGLHTRRLLGGARVDALQSRVRVRRSQDAAVDHARTSDVVRILGAARDLLRAVDARDARAEQPRFLRPGVGWMLIGGCLFSHESTPLADSAAFNTPMFVPHRQRFPSKRSLRLFRGWIRILLEQRHRRPSRSPACRSRTSSRRDRRTPAAPDATRCPSRGRQRCGCSPPCASIASIEHE